MNNLPIDLLKDIFLLVCLDNPPLLSYRMKYVNQCFYQIVNDYKGGLSNIEDTNDDRYILYDYGNIDIYRWLYDNKQFLIYEDVLGLILFRRVDLPEFVGPTIPITIFFLLISFNQLKHFCSSILFCILLCFSFRLN